MEQSGQSVQNGCQLPQHMKLKNADKMGVCRSSCELDMF